MDDRKNIPDMQQGLCGENPLAVLDSARLKERARPRDEAGNVCTIP